jgi:hypothetical protein
MPPSSQIRRRLTALKSSLNVRPRSSATTTADGGSSISAGQAEGGEDGEDILARKLSARARARCRRANSTLPCTACAPPDAVRARLRSQTVTDRTLQES